MKLMLKLPTKSGKVSRQFHRIARSLTMSIALPKNGSLVRAKLMKAGDHLLAAARGVARAVARRSPVTENLAA